MIKCKLSFLDRLNLRPKFYLQTTSPSEKKTNEKKQTKRQRKSYTTGAKRYLKILPDQLVKHEKKRELQVRLLPKKVPHTLHSLKIYKSLQKRRWKLIHYFLLLRPNYSLEHYITKRKKEYKICYASGQNLPWFKFYQGMVRTMKMSFYNRKIYLDQCLFAYSTESFRFRTENYRMWSFCSNKHISFSTSYWFWLMRRKAFYRHCIPPSISINDTTIARNFRGTQRQFSGKYLFGRRFEI